MKRLALLLCLIPLSAFGQASATRENTQNQPYSLRYLARAMGNFGGWWSFLSESDKSAFLDGYQTAMKMSYLRSHAICIAIKNGVKPSTDNAAFMDYVSAVIAVCTAAEDLADFDKVTVKDLDNFYSERANQPVDIEWTLPYLRDRATGRKTKGQLLDALEAEQKDVHDCTKYPHLCKLGVE